MKILALFSRVLSAFPGTSQFMGLKVCRDQLLLSMSLLQSRGLLAACRSRWANRHVADSFTIDSEAGFKGRNERDEFGGF